MATKNQIISEINNHLTKSRKQCYSDFYVGTTNNIERRLFGEHNVKKNSQWYIWEEADSKDVAQEVEKFFLNKGMQGDTGGGNADTVFVYCYEITRDTIE